MLGFGLFIVLMAMLIRKEGDRVMSSMLFVVGSAIIVKVLVADPPEKDKKIQDKRQGDILHDPSILPALHRTPVYL